MILNGDIAKQSLTAESGEAEPIPPSISLLVFTGNVQTMKEAGATIWVANETTTIGAIIIDSGTNIALVAGGTSGSLLVILTLFLLLALLWVTIRKRQRCMNETESYNHHHHQVQIEGNNPQVRTVHMKGEGDQSVKVNNNCVYDKLDSLILTVINVAYNNSISDKHEYDYAI